MPTNDTLDAWIAYETGNRKERAAVHFLGLADGFGCWEPFRHSESWLAQSAVPAEYLCQRTRPPTAKSSPRNGVSGRLQVCSPLNGLGVGTLGTMRKTVTLVVLIFSSCLWNCFGQSGNAGTIGGSVVDPSGAVIKGATVQIQNPVSAYSRSTQTDSQGNFEFVNVPYNIYHVSAVVAGFQSTEQEIFSSGACSSNRTARGRQEHVSSVTNLCGKRLRPNADNGDRHGAPRHEDTDRRR
jgi:hypothetical protein